MRSNVKVRGCGDAAFDDWYSMQRHQLSNEDVCRVIWRSSWEAAQKEWRTPLTMAEVKMVATYAPEGVTDDDVELLVRKIEQMHGLTIRTIANREIPNDRTDNHSPA